MQLHVLGSSSAGNCYLLEDGKESLIIEAGVPYRDVMRVAGYDPSKIVGCIVSHSHNDHAGRAEEFSRRAIKIYANKETITEKGIMRNFKEITANKPILVGSFKVLPIEMKHDVPCLGFVIDKDGKRLVFATDTYAMNYKINGVTWWVIEANYSDEIINENLNNGSIDQRRYNRTMTSHMSLSNAINIVCANSEKAHGVIMIHLSYANSNEEEFIRRMQEDTGLPSYVATPGKTIELW